MRGKEPKAGRKQKSPNKYKLSAFKTAVAGGPLTAALPLKPFPGLRRAASFLPFCIVQFRLERKREASGPSGRAPFRPQKSRAGPKEKFAASGSGVGEGSARGLQAGVLSWRALAREWLASPVRKSSRFDTWAPTYLRPSLQAPAPPRVQILRQLRLRPRLRQL